ncbi:hypothetical protein [Spiroplasma endosymbiont of Cantharis nigra]|uniref:hypothetical protein n=1 Tax=Spiroplasma endosymbiont of Cantharis nigra TaxID=3066278 RepID=UPI0030CA7FE4
MYLNPFERMKKQREEDEKRVLEERKEQERLTKLGTQMGFIDYNHYPESSYKNNINPSKNNYSNKYTNIESQENNYLYNKAESDKYFENNFEDFEEKHFANSISPEKGLKRENAFLEPQVYNQSEKNYFNENFERAYDESNQKVLKLNEIFENENSGLIISNTKSKNLITESKNLNNKIISKDKYISLKNKRELFSKNTLMVNHPELLNDMNNENLIYIDLQKIVIYSSPCLFFLKKFINNLPEKISLEDKKILWERTSVLLAATDWGKTTSEIDDILDDLNITNDPEKMFINEFINLLDSYNFNEKMNIVITNTEGIDLNKILLINEFIAKSLIKIPGLSCRMNLDSKVIDINRIDEISENFDYVIFDGVNSNEEFNLIENNLDKDFKLNKYKNESSNFEKVNIQNQEYNKLNFLIENETIQQQEENYDPGIDSILRINIDEFIEKQRNEMLDQKKLEEHEILKRKVNTEFNPSILSNNEVVIDSSITPSEGRRRFQAPSYRKEGVEIQESYKEIDKNLNLLRRGPISIENTFSNKVNQDKNTKQISVPGSWNQLKK